MPDRSDLAARLSSSRALAGAGALLLPALLALRLPGALDSQDSVNFALGLSDFDPGLEQPHFPGYPVYIALCRLLVRAGCSDELALALPGVLASAALIPALLCVSRRLEVPRPTRALSLLLLAAQPLLWLEGPRPIPDLLATSFAWVSLALVAGRRGVAAGTVLGLALGVRVDLLPLACAGFALPQGARLRFAAGIALGVAVWLPAFALALAPGGFDRGVRFAVGHFSVWGSTALSGAGNRGAARGLAFGLGAPVLPALGLLGGLRSRSPAWRFFALALGPYTLWVLLGQNLASPRHFLPLVPALALLAACAVSSFERVTLRSSALLAVAISALALPVVARPSHPDGRELVGRVQGACRDCSAIFAGESERLLSHYAPAGAPLYRRRDLDEVRRDLRAWPELAGRVGISSELAGSSGLGVEAVEVAPGLALYRIDAAALR